MIWIKCIKCGAEEMVCATDEPTDYQLAKQDLFISKHVPCGHIQLRDSYGRTFDSKAPEVMAPS